MVTHRESSKSPWFEWHSSMGLHHYLFERRVQNNIDVPSMGNIPGRSQYQSDLAGTVGNSERLSLSYELAAERMEFDRQFWMYLDPDIDDDLEPIAGHRADVRGTICPCGAIVDGLRGMAVHLRDCDGRPE